MKRFFCTLLVFCLVLGMLSGCEDTPPAPETRTITVKYLLYGSNDAIAEPRTISGANGDEYDLSGMVPASLGGYSFISCDTAKLTGKFYTDATVVCLYGTPVAITVKYTTDNGVSLAPDAVLNGYKGQNYDLTAYLNRSFEGYTLAQNPAPAPTGVYGDNMTVTMSYTKNEPVTPPSGEHKEIDRHKSDPVIAALLAVDQNDPTAVLNSLWISYVRFTLITEFFYVWEADGGGPSLPSDGSYSGFFEFYNYRGIADLVFTENGRKQYEATDIFLEHEGKYYKGVGYGGGFGISDTPTVIEVLEQSENRIRYLLEYFTGRDGMSFEYAHSCYSCEMVLEKENGRWKIDDIDLKKSQYLRDDYNWSIFEQSSDESGMLQSLWTWLISVYNEPYLYYLNPKHEKTADGKTYYRFFDYARTMSLIFTEKGQAQFERNADLLQDADGVYRVHDSGAARYSDEDGSNRVAVTVKSSTDTEKVVEFTDTYITASGATEERSVEVVVKLVNGRWLVDDCGFAE